MKASTGEPVYMDAARDRAPGTARAMATRSVDFWPVVLSWSLRVSICFWRSSTIFSNCWVDSNVALISEGSAELGGIFFY